jgi:hypothetical protein
MHRRPAFGPSTILLIVFALLASGAGVAVATSREALSAVATTASRGERSVERVHGQPREHDGASRAALRATSPAISRFQTPGGAGPDAARISALGVATTQLAVAGMRTPRQLADPRRDGVASPGQPAPSSRAPPIG